MKIEIWGLQGPCNIMVQLVPVAFHIPYLPIFKDYVMLDVRTNVQFQMQATCQHQWCLKPFLTTTLSDKNTLLSTTLTNIA